MYSLILDKVIVNDLMQKWNYFWADLDHVETDGDKKMCVSIHGDLIVILQKEYIYETFKNMFLRLKALY